PPIQWLRATVTGTVPTATVNTNLILYLSGAGHVYLDDIQLVAGTNADQGTNLIINGDFESGFAPWIANGSFTGSSIESNIVYSKLTNTVASLSDLRAWLVLHAVRSKTQLLEVLTQFFDNHFNTQYDKSKQWFDDNYSTAITNDTDRARLATDFEFRELSKWRAVLMDANGTFYDLLKISAESPAMIIYLDTVLNKKGNPNENYS